MRYLVTTVVILLITNVVRTQTLSDYLETAGKNNEGLRAVYLEYQAELEKIDQVSTLPDPEVSFGYFVSPIETRVGAQEVRFSVMQMFPWKGTLDNKEAVVAEMARVKFENFETARKMLFYKMSAIYFQLYELDRKIKISEDNLEILKTLETLSVQKLETGKSSMVDVLRVQMDIAEKENKIITLKEMKKPLTTRFNNYLNRDVATPVMVVDSLDSASFPSNMDILTDSVIAGNNQLKKLDHLKESESYKIDLAGKNGKPSFGVGLNYFMISQRTDMPVDGNGRDAFMPMVTLKLPIYRKKYDAGIREHEIRVESIEETKNDLENNLISEIQQIWFEYEDAVRRMKLYKEQVEKVGQALRILIGSYSSSGKDFEEILRLQEKELMFKLKYEEAHRDMHIAAARARSLM